MNLEKPKVTYNLQRRKYALSTAFAASTVSYANGILPFSTGRGADSLIL
jgi:hypothetical protein